MMQKLNRPNSRAFQETFTAYGCPVTMAAFPAGELADFRVVMCTQPKLSPEKMLSTFPEVPDFLSNGSFFETSSGASIMNVVSQTVTYSEDPDPRTAMGFGVISGSRDGLPKVGNRLLSWRDFLSAYPMLFLNGERQDVSDYADIGYAAQRMVFGQYTSAEAEDWYFFLLVEGSGCLLSHLQALLAEHLKQQGNAVQWAANLDGGGSAYLAVEGKRVSEGVQGSWHRPVDNVIAVYLKDMEPANPEPQPEPKAYWRISLGAFSVKANAEKYLATVRSLGVGLVDYTKAFLSYDAGSRLYRVQVGAFSQESGARAVAEELNTWGYATYVRYGT